MLGNFCFQRKCLIVKTIMSDFPAPESVKSFNIIKIEANPGSFHKHGNKNSPYGYAMVLIEKFTA